jgi:FSR family fosmidomycin resistance protein-like MFS transporter
MPDTDSVKITAGGGNAAGLAGYMKGLVELIRNRALVLITMSSMFRSMTQKTITIFLPLFLYRELGYTIAEAGFWLAVMQIGGLIATPISGYLSDKFGRQETAVISMGLTAVVLVAMALMGRSSFFVFLVAALGFFLFAIRAVIQAWVLEVTPKRSAGATVGILFGTQSLGSAVGPLIGGFLSIYYGIIATFWFVAVTICIGNALVLFMPKEPPRVEG